MKKDGLLPAPSGVHRFGPRINNQVSRLPQDAVRLGADVAGGEAEQADGVGPRVRATDGGQRGVGAVRGEEPLHVEHGGPVDHVVAADAFQVLEREPAGRSDVRRQAPGPVRAHDAHATARLVLVVVGVSVRKQNKHCQEVLNT